MRRFVVPLARVLACVPGSGEVYTVLNSVSPFLVCVALENTDRRDLATKVVGVPYVQNKPET